MGSIKRLDLYRATRKEQREYSRRTTTPGALEEVRARLGGKIISRESRSILKVEQLIPRNQSHGSVGLERAYAVNSEHLLILFPQLLDEMEKTGTPPGNRAPLPQKRSHTYPTMGDLLFFDIETTGLSGGAGTYLFLAGFLKIEEKGFRVVQYFLNNYSSELLYLEEIGKELLHHAILVSYNGKSYDFNIMKNRYIMGGLPFYRCNPVHLDLLYTSRRIWKGLLPDFSLQTVEQRILGLRRVGDIPGWQIPDVYSNYLRGRSGSDALCGVFSHNRTDVLTLLALLLKQLELVSRAAGRKLQEERFNPITLSDMFLSHGNSERALQILSAHRENSEALKRLALLHKREGDFVQALLNLEQLCVRGSGLSDYLFACTEAAKIYEWVYRDFRKALVYTKKMLGRVERVGYLYPERARHHEQERELIMRRLRRLQRKIGRIGQRGIEGKL